MYVIVPHWAKAHSVKFCFPYRELSFGLLTVMSKLSGASREILYSSSIVGTFVVLGFKCFLLACNHTKVVCNRVYSYPMDCTWLVYTLFSDCWKFLVINGLSADCDVAVIIRFTF